LVCSAPGTQLSATRRRPPPALQVKILRPELLTWFNDTGKVVSVDQVRLWPKRARCAAAAISPFPPPRRPPREQYVTERSDYKKPLTDLQNPKTPQTPYRM
jgi:hypothetical protein